MPRVFKPGGNGACLIWAREGWPPLPRNALRDSIIVSVSSLDQMKVYRADPIKVSVASLDGERATFAHLYPPHMGPRCFEFGRDDSPHPITRLEASDLLLPHLVASRKSFLRPVSSAMVSPSGCLERKRFELARPDTRQIPNAQGIEGMRLLDSESRPVPPCLPACPGTDGQAKNAQGLDQLEPGRVDRRCVLEWAFGQRLHLRMAELNGSPVPFGGVAVVTAERQIRDAVGASATAWKDVVKLERAVSPPAIDTSILVLDVHVRPGLHPASVPCWYSVPLISGFCKSWVSNLTRSTSIRLTGDQQASLLVQVTVLPTLESRDGGNQPPGIPRLSKRGAR
jgi:hypothetical protein